MSKRRKKQDIKLTPAIKKFMQSRTPHFMPSPSYPAMWVLPLDLTMSPSEDARAKHKMRSAFEDLKGKVAFNDWELQCLLQIYYKLTIEGPMGRPEFRNFLYNVFAISRQDIVERIFSALDDPNTAGLTPHAFVLALSVLLRGTLEEKVDFAFHVYDYMCLSYIGRDAMTKLLVPTLLTKRMEQEAMENAIDMVDLLMRKIDRDRDGRVGFAEFYNQALENPILVEVFGQVFPDRMDKYAFMTTFTPMVTTMHKNFTMKTKHRKKHCPSHLMLY